MPNFRSMPASGFSILAYSMVIPSAIVKLMRSISRLNNWNVAPALSISIHIITELLRYGFICFLKTQMRTMQAIMYIGAIINVYVTAGP